MTQNGSLKSLKNEENKENLIKENEKSKSIIIIDDKKSMDISLRHFSKPFSQVSSASAGLKKKNSSVHLHAFETQHEENEGFLLIFMRID